MNPTLFRRPKSFFAVWLAFVSPLPASDPNASSRLALERIEAAVSDVSAWLAECYDPVSGGFFECPELKTLPGDWGPDIQSTTQVLAIVFEHERVELLPAVARNRLIHFFDRRQQPDGWFVDPHYPQMKDHSRVRARALGFAAGSLRQLGAAPRFSIPGTETGSASAPHLARPETVVAWVDALDWTNPWTALDRLSAEGPLFAALPDEQRDTIIDAALAAVRRHQNASTGLYGKGSMDVQLSGAAKFGWFCQKVGRRFPTPEASEKTLLSWVRSQPTVDRATVVRNVVQHLDDLQRWLTRPTADADRAMVLEWAASAIARFKVGRAFTIEAESRQWSVQPNDLRNLGEYPGPVASINGTAQILRIRGKAYSLAGIEEKPLPGLDQLIRAMAADTPTTLGTPLL